RGSGSLRRRPRVDGDDPGPIDEEGDVPEIESFGDIDAIRLAHEPGIRESESLFGSDGEVARDLAVFEGTESRSLLHLSRTAFLAFGTVRPRQSTVDRPIEIAGEALADVERCFQISHRLLRLAEALGQIGEDQAAQETPGAGIWPADRAWRRPSSERRMGRCGCSRASFWKYSYPSRSWRAATNSCAAM